MNLEKIISTIDDFVKSKKGLITLSTAFFALSMADAATTHYALAKLSEMYNIPLRELYFIEKSEVGRYLIQNTGYIGLYAAKIVVSVLSLIALKKSNVFRYISLPLILTQLYVVLSNLYLIKEHHIY